MIHEGGQMSIDFLAGIFIFLLALITVVTIIPGLLIGLQSATVDVDAVAYRTGVVLVEDPGMPSIYDDPTLPFVQPWEQKDAYHKADIQRMGLAVSKTSPLVLSRGKVEAFFNDTFFTFPDDYRGMLIFGDFPYRFNITLRGGDGTSYALGDMKPFGHGYIRRVVTIRDIGDFLINGSIDTGLNALREDEVTEKFTVRIDCIDLLNKSVNPAYRIDPRIHRVWINVTHFEKYLNNSNPGYNEVSPIANVTAPPYTSATLVNVSYRIGGQVEFPFSNDDPDKYRFYIDGSPATFTPDAPVGSNFSLLLEPNALPYSSDYVIDIIFTFSDKTPHTMIHGTATYSAANEFTAGVLEVAVW